MPEIKHTFQAGKMNKDVDERLVPNGEYRDALNVQIRTTDNDAIGTVQNILSTSLLWNGGVGDDTGYVENWMFTEYNSKGYLDTPEIIGSIGDEKTNKVYFFIRGPYLEDTLSLFQGDQSYTDAETGIVYWAVGEKLNSERNFIDLIVEHDTATSETLPVVVDKYAVVKPWEEVGPVLSENSSINSYTNFIVNDVTKYRVGMTIKALDTSGVDYYATNSQYPKIKSIDTTTNVITLHDSHSVNIFEGNPNSISHLVFVNEDRPLNFSKLDKKASDVNYQHITGINIIDNLLFWTDNKNEPKKINIDRCKAGCAKNGSFKQHTKLTVSTAESTVDSTQYDNIADIDLGPTNYPTINDLKESHVTVIRKAPRYAPTLEMSDKDRDGLVDGYFEGYSFINPDSDEVAMQSIGIGSIRVINNLIFAETQFLPDDILIFRQTNNDPEDNPVILKAKFLTYETDAGEGFGGTYGEPYDSPSNRIRIQMVSVDPKILNWMAKWDFSLEKRRPIYELKFGRFGYRYKYEDGEYSTFSPWSEIAFLPDKFDYQSKKGYNLGMVNTLRSLIVRDFIPYPRPLDVVAVDILWKNTDSPNIYVVQTVKRGKDAEWEEFTTGGIDTSGDGELDDDDIKTGELKITSEMIHRVLPSNQLLRSWDNVPTKALAQEIVGNRLLYGNYSQGYNFPFPVSLKQKTISDTTPSLTNPKKSIKSIRDYKFGMVFGDKYGRETPVMTSSYITSDNESNTTAVSGDLIVPKSLSSMRNIVELEQQWTNPTTTNEEPLEWMDYVKYYVKEPTNEYYNLVLDRWYWAEDEQRNIWLSFNSADRNKLDEETYLILKNRHNSQVPVLDKARYKIMAIENDAPGYVKTERLLLGKSQITNAGQGGDWSSFSSDLEPTLFSSFDGYWVPMNYGPDVGLTTKRITIGMLNWLISTGSITYNWETGEYGDVTYPLGREIKGQLKIRLRGRYEPSTGVKSKWLYTRWQTVSHYRVLGMNMLSNYTDTNYDADVVEFQFNEAFGSEIDFYTRFIEADPDLTDGDTLSVLEYFVELREDVETHKAEYDGKFFAKIEGDGVILSNIIGATSTSQGYVSEKSYPVHYISSNRSNEGGDDVLGEWGGYEADIVTDFYGDFNTYCTADELSSEFGGVCDDQGLEIATENFFKSFRISASEEHGGSPNFNSTEFTDVSFLDNARIFEGSLENDGETQGTFTPPSFDAGVLENGDGSFGAQSDTMGRMTLSYLIKGSDPNNAEDNNIVNPPNELKDDLIEGVIFRWAQDPNPENIYRVIGVNYGDSDFANGNQRNFGGDIDDCDACSQNENPDHVCERVTYQVEFRRIEPFTTELAEGNVGMILSNYDPRAHMTHWGVQHQNIEILRLDTFDFTAAGEIRDGAMWETEPKKSTELDIYYEASNAIPMRLNEDNIYDFAPINSKISVLRPNDITTPTSWNEINLPNTSLYRSWIGNLADKKAIVNIRTQNTSTGEYGEFNNVLFGDKIQFEHRDGTITSSKVTGIAQYAGDSLLVDSSNSTFVDENLSTQGFLRINFLPNGSQLNPDGQAFFYLYSVAGETRTFTDANGVEQTVPRVWITNHTDYWVSDDSAAYNQVINTFNNFNDVQCNLLHNNAIDPSAIPSAGVNDLPAGSSLLISGLITTFDDLEGFQTNTTGDNVPPSPAEVVDQNQFNAPSDSEYTVFVEVELSDYSLFPIDTSGSEDEFDDDGNLISDYNDNYGNYKGVMWGCRNLSTSSSYFFIDTEVWKYPIKLGWFNCYSYGNGVESDRIRDDYNADQIDNGVKVSTTFFGYGKERKGSGMIYSGLYNSISEVNNLNEFNVAEKITKDLNPSYGSIQRLKTRDTDVVIFTEDKVLKVLANKDALYNADGNPQLTATDRVLGTAVPFVGDYGISKNPESLAWDQFRMYFTDMQRGAVLRLSRDGLTPISNVGMKSFFRKNLNKTKSLLGTYDIVNGEYNLTLDYAGGQNDEDGNSLSDKTVSFNEGAKGWVSFKSFVPNAGESIGGKYITTNTYKIWDHYDDDETTYNKFYGTQYESSIKVLFNDLPGSIKSFKSINYEGTQSKVNQAYDISTASTIQDAAGNNVSTNDGEYYNLSEKEGWYVSSFETDLQSGYVPEFIEKEGKWFNKINGVDVFDNLSNLDTSEFITQGIGAATWFYEYTPVPDFVEPILGCMDENACNYNSLADTDDGSCAELDCFGDCGGSAVEDECGECGGSGPAEGFDCDGNEIVFDIWSVSNNTDDSEAEVELED